MIGWKVFLNSISYTNGYNHTSHFELCKSSHYVASQVLSQSSWTNSEVPEQLHGVMRSPSDSRQILHVDTSLIVAYIYYTIINGFCRFTALQKLIRAWKKQTTTAISAVINLTTDTEKHTLVFINFPVRIWKRILNPIWHSYVVSSRSTCQFKKGSSAKHRWIVKTAIVS